MKLALITGASSGIGLATARALVADDYRVVLVARGRDKLEELATELGSAAVVEAVDASDGEQVLAMAERVQSELGVPDVVVNCAGVGEWKYIEDTSPEEALAMMKAPYFAAFNVTHAFMKGMLARGSGIYIHVGSPASTMPWPAATGYTAARWALRGMHEALLADLRGTGVHSCHVVFGKVSTAYFSNNQGTEEKIPSIANTVPTITAGEAARVIMGLTRHPRPNVVHPFMMRVYYWSHAVAPGLVRWLLRTTGAKR